MRKLSQLYLYFCCALVIPLAGCGSLTGGSGTPSPPPIAGKISRTAAPPDGFDYHTATLLNNGSVLITGGTGLSTFVHKQTYRYMPAEDRFVADAALLTRRVAHTAFALADGRVVVAGGFDPLDGGTPFDFVFASTEIYDPVARSFSAGPDMPFPRRQHLATQLKGGRVLITGGIQLRGSGFGAALTAMIYDPVANQFTATGATTEGRWLHTATLLKDGRVLVIGGRSNNCTENCPIFSLKTAELFDPATGSFTPTGSLNFSRYNHTATLLSDGRVLVLGGESTEELGTGNDQVGKAEIYDPTTGLFSVCGNLVLPRSVHTTTVLNDGKLLLAGGLRISGIATERTEIFDPTTCTSREGPSMAELHLRHTATSLPDGKILFVGGSNGVAPVAVAEIYH